LQDPTILLWLNATKRVNPCNFESASLTKKCSKLKISAVDLKRQWGQEAMGSSLSFCKSYQTYSKAMAILSCSKLSGSMYQLLENTETEVGQLLQSSIRRKQQARICTKCVIARPDPNFYWHLSFSYGRALQQPVLEAWQGKPENTEAAQKALYKRAKLNGAARYGKYSEDMEQV
jgi:hypothetical protein